MKASPTVPRLRFRRAPLAAAALCFALGILLNHAARLRSLFEPTLLLVAALTLLALLTALAFRRAQRIAWLPVAALWIVLGSTAAEWQPGPARPLQLLSFSDDLTRIVRGRVIRVRTPRPKPHPPTPTPSRPGSPPKKP